MKKFTKREYLIFLGCIGLVVYAMWYEQYIQVSNKIYFPKELTKDEVKLFSNTDAHAIVIYPIFTQNAYKTECFYPPKDHTYPYNINCSLKPFGINGSYVTGLNGYLVLKQLNYSFIDDIAVDQHPEILQQYDKVILLHNEYMTQREFDAVKNHPHVLYLYPNSMYARVTVNYDKSMMTLDRGHSYPEAKILNGFGYVTSTEHEYDLNCKDYKWETRPNGIQPTCWPEFSLKSDRNILQVIKDFPEKLPFLVHPIQSNTSISNLPNCNQYGYCTNDTKSKT